MNGIPLFGKGLTIGILVILLQIALLINADAIFGASSELARNVLITYLVMEAVIMASLKAGFPSLEMKFNAIIYFFIGFFVTGILFLVVSSALPASFFASLDPLIAIGVLGSFAFSFVKAYIEEALFRHVLPVNGAIGYMTSNILFAVFHFSMLVFASYSLYGSVMWVSVLTGMVTLFILGWLWTIIKVKTNLLVAVGSHLAWNMGVAGTLPIMLGMLA